MLLGLIGDGREYVSFSVARGTWRLAFVQMMAGARDSSECNARDC